MAEPSGGKEGHERAQAVTEEGERDIESVGERYHEGLHERPCLRIQRLATAVFSAR
jgi:hypothetical protein